MSHEWSDYSQVQNLYSKGHEMASHSIRYVLTLEYQKKANKVSHCSHSFGEKFSKERWMAEIAGKNF